MFINIIVSLSESVNRRKTDNTMIKRQTTQWSKDRKHNGQRQTIQWSKDRQRNGQKTDNTMIKRQTTQ
jgi:hypothetical protein